MFHRSISWFICILVAVVMATNYSDPLSITGSNPKVTVYHLRNDSKESSTVEPDHGIKQTTATDLGALLDAGDGATVTLVAGETRLEAHRAVLAARSPVFASVLGSDTLEASSGLVTVLDTDGPVLRQLLVYLYTLQAPHLPSMAPQLLAAADRYGVWGLKAECERQVVAELSVETAAATAVLAVKHSSHSLSMAAINFIREHFVQVTTSQSWIDALRSEPEYLGQVRQLLSQSPTDTSPAAAEGSQDSHSTQPHSGHSGSDVTAAPPTAVHPTLTPDDTDASRMWNLSRDVKGWRLLEAAEKGSVEDVQALLAAGACLETRDGHGATALHWAVARGHVQVARDLLDAGAYVNVRDDWLNTPLQVAAWNGYAPLVRLLASSRADLNARDESGRTPLHWAAQQGHVEAVTALLEEGAKKDVKDNEGDTPLDVARKYNRQQLIDMLSVVAAGDSRTAPTTQVHSGHSPTPASATMTTALCSTPLHNGTTISQLCKPATTGSSQPSPSAQPHSEHSWTPTTAAVLSTATRTTAPTEGADVSRMRAPPTAASGTTPSSSRTPAPTATPTALCPTPPPDDPAVSRLRELTAAKKAGRLREAAFEGDVTALQAALAAGADAEVGNGYGWTALHSAAEGESVEAARCLLASGAAVDAREMGRQWTPLHFAAFDGNVGVLRLLLAAGADPNARDDDGWTPLHYAAFNGRAEVAAALLAAGADRAAANNEGETPLDFAKRGGHQHLIDMLK